MTTQEDALLDKVAARRVIIHGEDPAVKDAIYRFGINPDGSVNATIIGSVTIDGEVILKDESGNKALITPEGELLTTIEDIVDIDGDVVIKGDSGNRAEVTGSGELKVSTSVSIPPASDEVKQFAKSDISSVTTMDYTIPNGKTLTIQRFFGGSNFPDKTAIITLQESVTTGSFVDVATIYVTGNSNQADLDLSFVGDGVEEIRIVRDPQGNSLEVFGEFIGFEVDT